MRIWLKFVSMGLIDSKSVLVQVMVLRHAGDKPRLEPNMSQFADANMRHPASLC